jgi:hypothetical protein
MKKIDKMVLLLVASLLVSLSAGNVLAAATISSTKVAEAPAIDGTGADETWKSAKKYNIRDQRLGVDITLKSVHTNDSVYFLVSFPDKAEDRLHKPWVWSKDLEVYQIGPQREDTFTFKWDMTGKKVNLSNFSDNDYQADVWYWKGNRTDPAGYSDDKMHILSSEAAKKSKALVSTSGSQRHLLRLGDKGKPAQKKRVLTDYQGDIQDQYVSQQPDGSRADIKAKGVWKSGIWTVEFGRKLDTGNDDDVQFSAVSGKSYRFGISISGLYGEEINRSKPHPYGQGRISDPLDLNFK